MSAPPPIVQTWDRQATKLITSRTELLHGLFDLAPGMAPDLFGDLTNPRRLVFIDENVQRLYPEIKPLTARYGLETQFVTVPGGELAKTSATADMMMAEMDAFGVARFQEVIGFGGGVLHDLLGVAAGEYRRGVPFRFFGTTLVAGIDAMFALKAAVNKGWKNRAGLYNPAVMSATDNAAFFATLSDADIWEGYSEMLKWAIAGDGHLFRLLEAHGPRLCAEKFAGTDDVTLECITRTIRGMLDELYGNAFEWITARLSYLGHALSTGLEPAVSHGRAVGLEITLVAFIAHARDLISTETLSRILSVYTAVGLPLWDRVLEEPERLTLALADTTLHRGGRQEIVVPCGPVGKVTFLNDLTPSEIHRGVDRLHAFAQAA